MLYLSWLARLAPAQIAVTSFHAEVIAAAKKARPDLEAYWIVSLKPAKGKKLPTAEELIGKARTIRADGLDLSASEALVGVQGITTDRPGWLRDRLKK